MRLSLRRLANVASLQLIALTCVALAGAGSVKATTLIVTNSADSGPGSLRDTLGASSDGDTIQFDSALNGQTIRLTGPELVVDKNIVITGPGPDLLTVSRGTFSRLGFRLLAVERAPAGASSRIFHILPGHVVTIEGLKIARGDASGGGIRNDQATLTVNNCNLFSNLDQTTEGGGGLYNNGANAMLTIVNSSLIGNLALGGKGGGIYNNGGRVTITNTLIRENMSPSTPLAHGGGIFNAGTIEIYQSTITDNHAGYTGGGIDNSGMLTAVNSTLNFNDAGTNVPGSGLGGAIFNIGTLEIINCTLSGNTAASIKGPAGEGGGIENFGIASIKNSTISDNTAKQDGGGVLNTGSSAALTIANSTVSGNKATRNGGGIANLNGGTTQISNTILYAGTSGVNLFNDGGAVTSQGYNLSSDSGGGYLMGSGDQINVNPMLGPLQDNGGPTFTHLLLAGSPAINAGDPAFTPPPSFDQRGPGYARVFNGRIDIGSLEVQPTPVPTPTATPTPTPSASPTPTPTATAAPVSLENISTRLRVETGDNVLIGGFIITGNTPKQVVLRGIGPSLAGFGLSDLLADPAVDLRSTNGGSIFQNDDWQENSQQAAQLVALGLAPPDPKESGIVATLAPAAYTAILAGKNNSTGVGLVEIYDTNQGSASQLANISTRGLVQTGNNVMIGGFILGNGSGTSQIVVRGIGPSLTQFGLSPVLTDPTLELRNADGALLLLNDDWQDDPSSAGQLTSHNLAPSHPKESGIYALLPPGAFTAILAGKNNGTGIGLVEIYHVP